MTTTKEELKPNDLQYSSHKRRGEHIVGKKIVVGAGKVADELYNCVFEDCEIRIECSGHATPIILGDSEFHNCVIWPNKIQKITNLKANFYSCEFRGAYETEFHGDVENCSFEKAKINHALFYKQGQFESCKFPSWPHILIKDLHLNEKDFMVSVPKMSLLWIMARKHPAAMIVNIEKVFNSFDQEWESIKDKGYITYNEINA